MAKSIYYSSIDWYSFDFEGEEEAGGFLSGDSGAEEEPPCLRLLIFYRMSYALAWTRGTSSYIYLLFIPLGPYSSEDDDFESDFSDYKSGTSIVP